MKPEALPWIILFLPLAAAALIALFLQHDRKLSAGLSLGAVLAGFILGIIYVSWQGWQPAARESAVTWLAIGDLQVDFGLRFDPLSLLMMLIVTGVAGVLLAAAHELPIRPFSSSLSTHRSWPPAPKDFV